jgi:hypothetical protein
VGDRLFRRGARLTLYRPLPAPNYFATEPNAIVIEQLRVSFEVTRDLEPEPNNATITIYNLAETTRAEMQDDTRSLRVRLDVGYDGNLARIFDGDARRVTSRFEGPDVVTKIEAGDGERAFRNARFSRSYPKGTDAKQIVKDLAGSMGLKVPTSAQDVIAGKEFPSGAAIHGPSEASMRTTLKRYGLGYSVQDGQLQILGEGEARADAAFVIDESTGLIGSPELGLEEGEYGQPGKVRLSCRVLVYPGIVPGSRLSLDARDVKGLFVAERVKHVGDTHASPWFTEIEGRPL